MAADAFEIFGGATYTRRSVLLQAMQWVLDPDGDPATVSDVPDVLNNSWGFRPGGCDGVFDRAIDALEAAGVPVVFAAGNRGAGFDTVAAPADRADLLLNAFAVGAADQRDGEIVVADNSLGGPTPCSPGSIKPEVVAPGDIPLVRAEGARTARASSRTGAFTSWAAPHVAGALALLSSLNPAASAQELKQALFSTARDIPPAGLDNRSGAGLINLPAAAEQIGGLGGVRLVLAGSGWDPPGGALSVQLANVGRLPFPGGTAEVRRRSDGTALGRSEVPPIAPRSQAELVFGALSDPPGGDARLTLLVESGGGRLEYPIALSVATASAVRLAAGEVEMSLDANGRLGQVAGAPGFSFLGSDWLTSGAFLFAAGDRVSDATYVDVLQQPTLKSSPVGSDTDWRAVSFSSDVDHADLSFSDDRALRPLGATVVQSVDLVAVNDSSSFVALTSTVAFDASRAEIPLAGLLLDWDFAGPETVAWDTALGASVMTPADSNGPWLALTSAGRAPTTHAAVPLGTVAGGFYVTGANDGVLAGLDGFSEAAKGRFMRLGGLQSSSAEVDDWAQLVTVGPLRSGESATFLFAAGSSREALGAALDSARAFVATISPPASAPQPARGLQLLPAYPNPFDPGEVSGVSLPFLVDRAGGLVEATLEIYTMSGRRVYSERRELDPDQPVEPFRWSGRLGDGEAAASGVYGYVIRVGGERQIGKFVLLK